MSDTSRTRPELIKEISVLTKRIQELEQAETERKAENEEMRREIAELQRVEAALKDSEERYRTLAEVTNDMIFVINRDDCVEYVNHVGARQFGYLSEEKIIGRPRAQLFPPEIAAHQKISLQRVFQTGKPIYVEGRTAFPGRDMWHSTWLVPLKDSAGIVRSALGIARDITERKHMEEQLHAMSLTDELTGLYNRRGFITLSEQQLKIAERTKKDMLFFFLDLDKLKQINDTLGHQEGDKALIEVATILKEVFRESDIVGRIGGDEFAILAIDTTDEIGGALTNRLYNAINNYNKPEERKYHLSVSIGIAHYDRGKQSTLDELMAQADILMYEEKINQQH